MAPIIIRRRLSALECAEQISRQNASDILHANLASMGAAMLAKQKQQIRARIAQLRSERAMRA